MDSRALLELLLLMDSHLIAELGWEMEVRIHFGDVTSEMLILEILTDFQCFSSFINI